MPARTVGRPARSRTATPSTRCSRQRFDYVYHLAAYAAEGLSHFIKRFNYTNNVIGSVNLINAAVNPRSGASSSPRRSPSTAPGRLPMTEEHSPHPEDPYGIAKWRSSRS